MPDLTETQLERLRRLIDMPKRQLRVELALDADDSDADALRETHGMSRGELIERWIDEEGL